jgi:hypothetical protein
MYRKLACLAYFVFVLSLAVTSAKADLTEGLGGWWTFDEGTGAVAYDSSGNGNDGTLHGPVEWTPDGKINGALAFTGPYNYVLVPDAPSLNPTREISIAAWINPSWTDNNRILQKSEGTGDNQYRLLKEWGDHTKFHLSGVGELFPHHVLPPLGEWTHLGATYDGSSMKLYFDATVVAEMDASGDIATSNGTLCIGRKHETAPVGDEFNGLMDDVRIYNRALSESEIQQLAGAIIPATVDIDPDTLNLSSKSMWVTCYIELDDGYDVMDIDGATVMLEDIPAYIGNEGWARAGANSSNIMDHDGDGILERMVKFDMSSVQEYLSGLSGDAGLMVTGDLIDGPTFEGIDVIRVIDKSN